MGLTMVVNSSTEMQGLEAGVGGSFDHRDGAQTKIDHRSQGRALSTFTWLSRGAALHQLFVFYLFIPLGT